jgi:hypothetical protein
MFQGKLTEINTAEHAAYRRRMGLILGATLGLCYGLVSQTINRLALPGTPLHQPPLGPFGNTAVWLVIGAALGAATTWPSGALAGTFLGSGLAALAALVANLIGVSVRAELIPATVIVVLFLWLPFVGVIVPILGLFCWMVHGQQEAQIESTPLYRRVLAPAGLFILVAAVGALSLHDSDARQQIAQMNALVRSGLQARSPAALPPALSAAEIGGFAEHASPSYTLEWTQREMNRYRIPRPLTNYDQHAIVVARFDNGWVLACLFVAPAHEPICQGYERETRGE